MHCLYNAIVNYLHYLEYDIKPWDWWMYKIVKSFAQDFNAPTFGGIAPAIVKAVVAPRSLRVVVATDVYINYSSLLDECENWQQRLLAMTWRPELAFPGWKISQLVIIPGIYLQHDTQHAAFSSYKPRGYTAMAIWLKEK